ncbi:MAG: phage tail tape measure protein [Intestinibacter bartlettii]
MANKNEDVTTKFKVDISEFRSGIKEANNIIKLANAQFKAATSGMDDWKNSTDGISAKIEQLNSVLQAQKQKLSSYQQQYEALTNAQEENGRRAEALRQQYNEAVSAFGQTSTEAKQLASALNQVEQEQARNETAANNMRIQILNQEAAVGNTEREIRNYNSSLSELENASSQAESDVQDLADAAQDAGDSAQEAEGGFTVLKGALSDLVSQGINAAIDGFKELMTSGDQAMNSFQAQTGKSSEEMKAFNEQIQDLYKNNYGESLEDVADAMAKVAQNTKETDPSKIKDLTQEALTLRDTFGYEVPESMRAVNMLMDQFGLSGEEAFNLIAQGAQNGLDKNDDLLDTINEYSVHFSQAGYSAEEMFNSLKNGTDAGTFSVDKLGDAVKEFGIRMKDGTANDSLKELGLNVDDVTKRFAQGGEVGADAMGEVVDALFKIKDPLKQNTIGTQLFGTMWEDLGAEGVSALMDINGEFDRTTDTMGEIDDIKYDDIGAQLSQLGRTIQTELLQPLVSEILPTVKDFVSWLIENSSTVCAAIAGIGAALATMAVANIIMGLVQSFQAYKAATEGATIAQWALNSAMLANPIGIIIALIVGLVAAFVVLWNKNEAFRNFFINAWGNIKEFFGNAIEGIKTKLTEWGTALVNFVTTTIPNFIQSVGQFFSQLPAKIGYVIGLIIGYYVKWNVDTINFIVTNVPKWISSIIKFFSQLPGKIWTWLLNTISKVTTWGSQMGSKSSQAGRTFITNVINFIKNLPSRVWQWLNSTIQKAISFATTFPQKGKKAADDFKNKLVNGLKSIPSKMGSIGKEIVRGIWSGISGAGGWLKSQISGFASGVVKGFKAAFKIKSPSRIMKELIGRFIARGVGVGIVAETKNVVKQAGQFSTSVKDAIATNLSGISTNISPVASSLNIPTVSTGFISEIKEALSGLKISLPEEVKINLVLSSGEVLASIVAPFIDVIQGNNIILTERGLA